MEKSNGPPKSTLKLEDPETAYNWEIVCVRKDRYVH